MNEKWSKDEIDRLNRAAAAYAEANGLADDESDDLGELPAPPREKIPAADLELLQLAALAIGAVRIGVVEGEDWLNLHFADGSTIWNWNPLAYKDNAFDLAVQLRMEIAFEAGDVVFADGNWSEPLGDDPSAATCRAIVRAAAEIAKSMGQQQIE